MFKRVFVSEKDDASVGFDTQAGQHHAFDEQVWHGAKQDAVLECPWFTFVGIADDVLGIGILVGDQSPLASRGESGTAHTSQSGEFEA